MVWDMDGCIELACFLGNPDSTKLAGTKVAGNHATHAAEGTSQGRDGRDAKCHLEALQESQKWSSSLDVVALILESLACLCKVFK